MLRLIFCAVVLLSLVFLTFKRESVIEQDPAIEFTDISGARDVLSRIRQAAATPGLIALELHNTELIALSNSLSDLEKQMNFQFLIDGDELSLKVQKEMNLFAQPYYLSATCQIRDQLTGVGFERCKLGHIVLPGSIAHFVIRHAIGIGMGEYHKLFFDNVLVGTSLGNQLITVVAEKPDQLEFSQSPDEILSETLARAWFAAQFVNQQSVETYIYYLNSLQFSDRSLANWVFRAFEFAMQAPNGLSPEDENEAALWALAIAFGDQRFSQFIGEKGAFSWATFKPATLANRRDLTQHFLFSVVLYLVGNAEIALSVGQFKEFSDSLSGGSGYSFADLAADKAGLKFAEMATDSEQGARAVQCLLNGKANELFFFPSIRGLPEGLRDYEFTERYGDQKTPQYATIENLIDQRIAALPVQQESYLRLCSGML